MVALLPKRGRSRGLKALLPLALAVGLAAGVGGAGSGGGGGTARPVLRHIGRPRLSSHLVAVARSHSGVATARAEGLGVSGSRVRVVVESKRGRTDGAAAAVGAAGGETLA